MLISPLFERTEGLKSWQKTVVKIKSRSKIGIIFPPKITKTSQTGEICFKKIVVFVPLASSTIDSTLFGSALQSEIFSPNFVNAFDFSESIKRT